MSEPRQHHYVPKSFLARFSETGTLDGQLHVLDKTNGKQWSKTPEGCAKQRDFYRLEPTETAPNDPNAIENFLAQVEDRSSAAMRELVSERREPTAAAKAQIMTLLAVQLLRSPAMLARRDEFFEDLLRGVVYAHTINEATWTNFLGPDSPGRPTPKEGREASMSRDFNFGFDQNTRMQYAFNEVVPLAKFLGQRRWRVVTTDADAPDLICSDQPVTVSWNNDDHPRGWGAWIDCKDTTVHVPITPRLAFLGTWDSPYPNEVLPPSIVAIINSSTAFQAERFVFSRAPDFTVFLQPRGMVGRDEFIGWSNKVRASRETRRRARLDGREE